MHFSASPKMRHSSPVAAPRVFEQRGVDVQDASDHARSLLAFEEMLEFLVIRLVSTAVGGEWVVVLLGLPTTT